MSLIFENRIYEKRARKYSRKQEKRKFMILGHIEGMADKTNNK